MENKISIDGKSRITVCLALVLFSLLLLGAGNISGRIDKKNTKSINEKKLWRKIVLEMDGEIPLEHKNEWKKCASENPDLLLTLNTFEFARIK